MAAWNWKKEATAQMELFLAIFSRFPEVSSLRYRHEEQILRFVFLVDTLVSEEQFNSLLDKVTELLSAHSSLKRQSISCFNFERYLGEQVTVMEIERDLSSFNQEELTLIIQVLSEGLGEGLVKDNQLIDEEFEADQEFNEELIGEMLETLKQGNALNGIYAYRDNGRVVVFNK